MFTYTSTATESTVAEVTAAYPGLRRAHPHTIGADLGSVELDTRSTARYAWCGYEVHVSVGREDYTASDNPSAYRHVQATATLLVPGIVQDTGALRSEIAFPSASGVAPADTSDPRFADAVLTAVAKALDHTALATAHAQQAACEAEQAKAWERERPEGVPRRRWLRQKRAERDTATGTP